MGAGTATARGVGNALAFLFGGVTAARLASAINASATIKMVKPVMKISFLVFISGILSGIELVHIILNTTYHS
jgi:hypothetical protein